MWHGSVELGSRKIHLETGEIAKQARGAVLVREAETVVLVTVAAAEEARADAKFFPLTVEYREKFSAAGKFLGGYRKREGRISDGEILSSRLIDRTIRPLFPDGFRLETQMQATVMSYESSSDPEVLSLIGAAAALHLSDLPWQGPVAAVRVATVDGELVIMPALDERERATLDLVVSSGPQGLAMVEGLAHEATEEQVIEALLSAEHEVRPVIELLERLRQEVGRDKQAFGPPTRDSAVVDRVRQLATEPLAEATRIPEKQRRREAIRAARETVLGAIAVESEGATSPAAPSSPADGGESPAALDPAAAANSAFDELLHDLVRRRIVGEGRRIDGREPTGIRPISGRVDWLPRTHGSAIFTRGETQALAVCTLGSGSDEQEVDGVSGRRRQRFYLHYSFPPYSVGEVRPLRGPGRREIGHGNLAQRALAAVLPALDEFPYTIRVESEISESNGSSSMATVCGGCLALMDAGVPIERPVAGIAMGLIQEGESIVVLSDILGDEDHLGDMDFKVAGTERGITAVQMDNKVGSLPREVLARALEQARQGRLHILEVMTAILDRARDGVKSYAPRIAIERIRTNRIRDLIGPGGSIIQRLQEETGVQIDIAQDGTVRVLAPFGASMESALARIHDLTGEPKVGSIVRGVVTGVKDFGCFVRVMGSIEGLVHVSELGDTRLEEGDALEVKVLGVDEQGKIKLSHKATVV